ncbi:hypothetical protein ACTQ54_02420 [Fundicoccus sp. Sow4_H7]|uniref:hypothetical protein n=1 Tax=Fundicoccus sp. Sow4_H7 TaxID=3438784 RepID=UPI003F92649F
MIKDLIKLVGYNLLTLTMVYVLTLLANKEFKWWVVIAMTSSSFIVSKYLENKNKKDS